MAFFNKKKEENKPVSFDTDPINFRESQRNSTDTIVLTPIQIMANDGVNICAEACACCWDTKIPDRYDKRADYITKRTRIGHGSVTEHSNNVFYLEVKDADLEDLCNVLANCKYLNTCCKHSKNMDITYFIIGGSWRGFNELVKRMSKLEMTDNKVFKLIVNAIYENVNKAGMADLVEMGILDDNFQNPIPDLVFSKQYDKIIPVGNQDQSATIINCDDLDYIVDFLMNFCSEPELFTRYDLLDFCTITVLFKNMSRIITQQLTRHRNAITQESQRYVNYSKGGFNSPAEFKNKYDPKYQYSIQFGRSSQKMTLQEIGDSINSIYGQLIDEARTNKHNLQFEDARGYLANNTKCGKIYITFTWRSFFKFLELREDLHAQVEIREFAKALREWFRELYPYYADLYDALKPKSINESHWTNSLYRDTNIDEVNEVLSEDEIIQKMEDQIAYEEKSEDIKND